MKTLLEDSLLVACHVASWVLPLLMVAATAVVWWAAIQQSPIEAGVSQYQVATDGVSVAGATVWLTTLVLGVPGAMGLYFRLGGRP